MTSADQDFGSQRRRGGGRRDPAHDAGSPAPEDYYQADYYQSQDPGWTGQPAPGSRPGPARPR